MHDREIVALSGAHALGRCHADASGYEGPWTGTPLLFNNSYFTLLKGLTWTPDDTKAKFQYTDPSGKLMMLPSDIALIEDPKFKKVVLEYAKDQKVFFKDFAAAFEARDARHGKISRRSTRRRGRAGSRAKVIESALKTPRGQTSGGGSFKSGR